MPQKLVNGTVTTQIRFSYEEAVQILTDAAVAAGFEVTTPDFGAGEADAITISAIDTGTNVNRGSVVPGRDLVLVLVDEEDDSPTTPEE